MGILLSYERTCSSEQIEGRFSMKEKEGSSTAAADTRCGVQGSIALRQEGQLLF